MSENVWACGELANEESELESDLYHRSDSRVSCDAICDDAISRAMCAICTTLCVMLFCEPGLDVERKLLSRLTLADELLMKRS